MIAAGDAVEILRRGLKAKRAPHAICLIGPPGIGKRTLARSYAATIFCESGQDDACGDCDSCRSVAARTHPDLLVVRRFPTKLKKDAPLNDEEEDELKLKERAELSTQIRIFQIRELAHHASFAAKQAPARIFVIDPADRMNQESQNALLKTLEEPPHQTRVLLLTSRPHRLLPTVRSRCLSVRLPALPPDLLASELVSRGIPAQEARERAGLAGGRPGLALGLDPEEMRTRRDDLLGMLETVAGTGAAAMADLPAHVSLIGVQSEREIQEGLESLSELLREGLRIESGVPAECLLDEELERRVARLAARLGRPSLAQILESIDRTRDELRFNINRTLAVESLLTALASRHPG